MDFLLQKSSNSTKSVSASACSLLYNNLCKFFVEECAEEIEGKLIAAGRDVSYKIPDMIQTRLKTYPALEEKEKYLLFVLNEYWKFLAHKSVQIIERSVKSANECNEVSHI